MRFDNSARLSEVVWNARIADMPRGQNRAILNRTYNGEPPFDDSKSEENAVEINRNFLQGTRLLTDARRQWNSAFLKPGNYFTVNLDSGPGHKRVEWSHKITKNLNRYLKRSTPMMEQIRASGAQTMLHGIGPTMWRDRRDPIPSPIPISSLLIPSKTDIDFQNLEWFAVFREWTPTQLYWMTHGPKVDPGWNMRLAMEQLKWVATETQKRVNSLAYQYMPERVEELIKQDGGFWGSDAVPTVDVWDCYFRELEDGKGWYRRIFLDWEVGKGELVNYANSGGMPNNDRASDFLYTSGKRQYSASLSEILHCQFGDCSSVAPFKYHSVRSLGWMLWGLVDLMNRLQCRWTESTFEQMLWFFRTSGQQDYERIKKAVFSHMGVIPQGVSFVTANERFKPDVAIINSWMQNARQLISENAASYVQDMEGGQSGREMTATETMARVNNVNAMVSGMLNLAYTYQTSQYREICRRFCIKNSPYTDVKKFRQACLTEGVPEDMLDVEKWDVEPERTIGSGNKTLEIAQANQLLQMRQFLGPDAQRQVDHIALEAFTDDPALAESLAPLSGQMKVSKSMHDAQLSTERILGGLPFEPSKEMVYEDYVQVWLRDMALKIQQIQQMGQPTMQNVLGLGNLGQHIEKFMGILASNEQDKSKLKEYSNILMQLNNFVKQMAQQVMESQQQGQQGQGMDPTVIGKIEAMKIAAQAKAQNARESHAEKTAQKQVSFEMDQQRKDRELAASIRRENVRTAQELGANQMYTAQELKHEGLRKMQELAGNALTQQQTTQTNEENTEG